MHKERLPGATMSISNPDCQPAHFTESRWNRFDCRTMDHSATMPTGLIAHVMKFIEIHAQNKIWIINPAQITHVEGNDDKSRGQAFAIVKLTEIDKSGASKDMLFQDDAGLQFFSQLRGLQLLE